jgi:hypothetical protein
MMPSLHDRLARAERILAVSAVPDACRSRGGPVDLVAETLHLIDCPDCWRCPRTSALSDADREAIHAVFVAEIARREQEDAE